MASKRKAATPGNVDELPVAPASLCFKSELNLIQKPPIAQNCISAAEYVEIDPVTAIRPDSKVIDFVLPNSVDAVYDLANCRFRVDFKIVDKAGNDVQSYNLTVKQKAESPDPPETLYDPVCASDNTLGSLFEKVEVAINDCVINSSDTNHHLKSFIMNNLNYAGQSVRSSVLALAGCHQDVSDPESTKPNRNLALFSRARYTENGKTWSLYGKLSHDIFNIGTVLPVSTKVAFRLHKSRDEVFLLVDDTLSYHLEKGYRVYLQKVQCECLRLRLTPETIGIMERQISNTPAQYFFSRMESRTFYIPPNSIVHTAQNIFSGLCPSRIFFAFQPMISFQGSYSRNSLAFMHNNISSLTLRIDNRIHGKTLNPTWDSESGCLETYIELLKTLRTLNRNLDVEPSFRDYKQGPLTIFGWDLSDDLSQASQSRRIGSLSLETRFNPKCSEEGICVYVLGAHTSSLFIDNYGGVVLENERRT